MTLQAPRTLSHRSWTELAKAQDFLVVADHSGTKTDFNIIHTQSLGVSYI